jgi:hypothetical protein
VVELGGGGADLLRGGAVPLEAGGVGATGWRGAAAGAFSSGGNGKPALG